MQLFKSFLLTILLSILFNKLPCGWVFMCFFNSVLDFVKKSHLGQSNPCSLMLCFFTIIVEKLAYLQFGNLHEIIDSASEHRFTWRVWRCLWRVLYEHLSVLQLKILPPARKERKKILFSCIKGYSWHWEKTTNVLIACSNESWIYDFFSKHFLRFVFLQSRSFQFSK